MVALWLARRSVSASNVARTFTFSLSCVQVLRKVSNVARWNSSGKTWIMQSIKYDCAMVSLQLSTSSSTFGSTFLKWRSQWTESVRGENIFNTSALYSCKPSPSSWLRRTRFTPTRIRSSSLSFSLFFLSLEAPWDCNRTQSRFVSTKFYV